METIIWQITFRTSKISTTAWKKDRINKKMKILKFEMIESYVKENDGTEEDVL